MALNLKDPVVERLAAEVARMTGESKTRAVRIALEERHARLKLRVARRRGVEGFLRYLREELWPAAPRSVVGKPRDRAEEERILGFGPRGV